ncbi:pirin family protein [Luteolibacter yonseiensis]|uniref:Pirin family protein n=1 Tax=Luteolibacter yonseiensis TaxID=1144680 RepID=A0A934R445_9BACT|nr:pirin family protein [Luteolibacter yonseiensis]MBK1816554.1 pirin family protein [Luteolibacter yonseiensis]
MTANLNLIVRRAGDRGHANHGWLDSWHTFSFADYYDPSHMGFRSLRVINDDRIAAGGGFPTHPHRDMEIFSYLLAGNLAHQDSMGNSRVLKPGEIQLMRAGSGVRHSEFNPSSTEPAHLLQIWITPDTRGLEPAYTEWTPAPGREDEAKTLVISSDGRDNSATIAQDASIYLLKLKPGVPARHELAAGRGLWLHVAKGAITVNGVDLVAGDAVSLEEPGGLEITSDNGFSEAILFDLG